MDYELRPVEPEDKARMERAFQRMSAMSRYQRFLTPHARLTAQELRYFTEVDHHAHEAIVALDAGTGEGIGIARYVAERARPDRAEFAVAVIDEWQGRGVGKALLRRLVERAREEGVTELTASILDGNAAMIGLLEGMGEVRRVGRAAGVSEYVVALPQDGLGCIAQMLREAARTTRAAAARAASSGS